MSRPGTCRNIHLLPRSAATPHQPTLSTGHLADMVASALAQEAKTSSRQSPARIIIRPVIDFVSPLRAVHAFSVPLDRSHEGCPRGSSGHLVSRSALSRRRGACGHRDPERRGVQRVRARPPRPVDLLQGTEAPRFAALYALTVAGSRMEPLPFEPCDRLPNRPVRGLASRFVV